MAIAIPGITMEIMPQGTTLQVLEEGQRLHNAGALREAEAIYRQVLSHDPNQPGALHLLGILAFETGHAGQAVELIRRAVAVQPNYPVAHANLGNILHSLGRFDEAIDACQRAIAKLPDYPAAHNTLGIALLGNQDFEAAIVSFRRALQIDPGHPLARNNLATALSAIGRLDEAIAVSREVLQRDSTDLTAKQSLIFMMQYHPDYDAAVMRREQMRLWDMHGAPLPRPQSYPNSREPERKIKLGYVSPDLSGHVLALNVLPLFEHHDHDRFEITCYSSVPRPDAMTRRFQSLADRWREISLQTDEQAAQLVREDGIDILVDLSQHMQGNRLLIFARQPAPVQVSFAGYPGSTGFETIQYRLTDPMLEPPGEGNPWFDEPMYIKSFWCYSPMGEEPEVSVLPALSRGIITFGCLAQFRKVSRAALDLWMRVLREVPNSRFILQAPRGEHRRQIENLLAANSIDPSRLSWSEYSPRRQYLERYHDVDIVLDTIPYNLHTTSLDGYWMGVPTVTIAGRTPVARGGVSELTNLGLAELIARDADDFVRIASELARDLPRLTALRASLRDRMRASVLCDQKGFARDIEEALITIWRRWCAKIVARDI